jgi:hypothetical protein
MVHALMANIATCRMEFVIAALLMGFSGVHEKSQIA